MGIKEKFIEIVSSINKDYHRVIWKPDKIYAEFGRRSIPEITESKEIHYLCCLERNYLVAFYASLENIETKLVMARIKRPFQEVKLATAIEVGLEDKTYTFVSATTGDKLIEEIYPYKMSHSNVHKIDINGIDFKKSWFENFSVKNLDELCLLVPGFDINQYLASIINKNSEHNKQKVLAAISRKRQHSNIYL